MSKQARKFCVIGRNTGRYANDISRHWFETEKGATEHARNLVAHNHCTAFVVEVVVVVEKREPPVHVRAPQQLDFEV